MGSFNFSFVSFFYFYQIIRCRHKVSCRRKVWNFQHFGPPKKWKIVLFTVCKWGFNVQPALNKSLVLDFEVNRWATNQRLARSKAADLTEIRLIRSNEQIVIFSFNGSQFRWLLMSAEVGDASFASHVADIPQTMKSNQQFVIECCNSAPVQPVNEKVHTEASQQGNASYRRESNWWEPSGPSRPPVRPDCATICLLRPSSWLCSRRGTCCDGNEWKTNLN